MNPRLFNQRDKRTTVVVEIPIPCDFCGQYDTICDENKHNSELEEISLVVKPMSWMKQQEIRANSYQLDAKTQSVQFDMLSYISASLEDIIVDAPWGNTNAIFMATIGPELGAALETLVPPLDGGSSEQQENIEKIKKVQNS